MRSKTYSLVAQSAAAASVAALQLPTAGTKLTLTASPVVFGTQKTFTGFGGKVMTPAPGTPSEVTITTLASATANNFTIVGLDRWGQPISEVLATPASAATTTSAKVYSQVNSITPSATDASHNVSAGVPQRVTTPWVAMNNFHGHDQAVLSYVAIDQVVGSATYALEGTAEALDSFGLGPNGFLNSTNLPTYTGDAAPIDYQKTVTYAIATGPLLIPPGLQFARLVITSAAATSAVAQFVRPGF